MPSVNPFRNLGLKIVSVFIALLLWLVVADEQPAERGLRVPLELLNLPSGIDVVDLPVESVDVRVRGASRTLGRLVPGDLVAVLDLETVGTGPRLFQLTPEQVRAPFGVEVVQVSPPTVALRFEISSSRRLPIAPVVSGEVAPGYVIGRVTADPAEAEVIGPQSVVAQMSELLTEPILVDGATASVRRLVMVGAASPNVRLKTPQRATVEVAVVPAPVERTLQHVPVYLRNVAPGLVARALPPVVAATLRGSEEAMARVSVEVITAFVDLAGLGAGAYELPVRVDRTTGFGVAGTDPTVVQIVLE